MPFTDTLTIILKKLHEVECDLTAIPKIIFLNQGLYKLTVDSISTEKYGFYFVETQFCDSTFSRKLLLIK